MQRYSITNKDIKSEIKYFNLSNIGNPTNFYDEYLEFYLNTPHNFIERESLNVNFKSIVLSNKSLVSLRPKVMVGITLAGEGQTEKYLWCYEDDTTEWYDIRGDGILIGYSDYIDEYEDEWEESFRTFRVNVNGVNVKEFHSDKWETLTSTSSDNTPLFKIKCGKHSGLDIAYARVISDTYFRIPYIELRNNVNILKKWWDDERKTFSIKTDYNYNHSERIWYDKLTENDISGRVICVETTDVQTYIPQDNTFSVISLNNLFQDVQEIRTPRTNVSNTYYDVPISIIEPCFDNEIEYTIILKNGYDNPKFSGIQRVKINCRGNGYTSEPTVNFSGGGGTGAMAYVTIKDGMIMDIVMSNNGVGYTSTPTIIFNGGGGTGAMATAILYRDEFDNIENMFLLYDMRYLTFYKIISNLSINFTLDQDYTLDTMRSELVSTKFINVEIKKAINPILDNERIRFEPVYKYEDPTTREISYYPINRIIYEFYFLPHGDRATKLYELGFSDTDVQYKKNALSKTFCRQTFFNDRNPTTQKLEYFNSIYVNIDKLYSNYSMSVSTISGNDPNDSLLTTDKIAAEFFVFNPLLEYFDVNYGTNQNDRTTIRYIQTSSSEGYFIHLFGEEYKNLLLTDIYMKTEFNNAKTGKRTLFFNRSHSNVRMNNIFFDIENSRQHIYTDITVAGVKVNWNPIKKCYEENLDDFELKYIWFPKKYNVSNIFWDINDYDKLIIKFYEASVQ